MNPSRSDSTQPTPDQTLPELQDRFPIVGIGASAGGLEAFQHLFARLPADTNMAFVLIQHLSPSHNSILSEILARSTSMPVCEVLDGVIVEPNCVYVIPPNTKMILSSGGLRLLPRQKVEGKYMPVDAFLSSLAAEWGSQSIAIVMSGGDGDGTIGLEAVKAAGGITFAQDLLSSKVASMPRNAVAGGQVDFVLSPAAIANELIKLSRYPYLTYSLEKKTAEVLPDSSDDSLPKIFALIRSATGVDFTHYKQATLKRRIMRRLVLHNLERLDNYVQFLQDNPSEVELLHQDILIKVTSFFRDPDTFEALKNTVFPQLMEDRSPDSPIRIWVAACATGEEAYSIVIALLEFLDTRINKPAIQIFATDISELAIQKARLGIYSANTLVNVSPERLRRFFVPIEGGYQIGKLVRELCVFARHDITIDPPFSRLDLVTCRNVLIYLGALLQKKVMPIFHYALKLRGFLMLGSSETTGESSDLFTLIDKRNRIYARKLVPIRLNFDFIPSSYPIAEKVNPNKPVHEGSWSDTDLQKVADQIVLNKYAPVGVVINDEMEILHFRGQTSIYLEPAPGKASLNLFKMVREGLLLELRTAIHQAKRRDAPVRKEGLQVKAGERFRLVNVEVMPFRSSPANDRYFLVLFEEIDASNWAIAPESTAKAKKARQTESEQETAQLRQELAATKDYLQSIIEDQEATNQDLKVANEEILSSNEELQSTNEELETAKEEIQATNEELSTINEELRSRNQELNQVNNDLRNLLSSVNIPILMLGGDLRIRRFTPMAERVFNLIQSDVGRPFSDIHPNVDVPNLTHLILEVIDSLHVYEQEVRDTEGRWYSLRIRPYKTVENQIDGAVIGLIDIDELKRSAVELEKSRDYATAIVETVREPLIVLDADLRVMTANQSFYQMFKVLPTQTEDQSIFDLGNGEWNQDRLRLLLEDIIPRDTQLENFEVEQEFSHIGHRTMLLNARKIPREGDLQMILLAIEDITARKLSDEQIRSSLKEKKVLLREIHHRVKNNLQIISSMLSLQSNRMSDLQARQNLVDSQNRVKAIALLHEILYESEDLSELDLEEYFQSLMSHLFRSYGAQTNAISSQVIIQPNLILMPDKAVLCGLILNELVTNALKYAFPDGRTGEICVTIAEADQLVTLTVSNNGISLLDNFTLDNLPSMGLNLVINLVQQLRGEFEFDRTPLFKVTFPT